VSERVIERNEYDPERYRVHIREISFINGEKRFDSILYQTGDSIPGFLRIEAQDPITKKESVELIPYSAISRLVIDTDQMSKTILKYQLL
jgi:hypothetical protein